MLGAAKANVARFVRDERGISAVRALVNAVWFRAGSTGTPASTRQTVWVVDARW